MRRPIALLLAALSGASPAALAFDDVVLDRRPIDVGSVDDPVQAAEAAVSQDVRTFDQHVTTLANPFFEGRRPGTRGNAIAREYIQWHFERAGLHPAFGSEGYRQAFPIGSDLRITDAQLAGAGPGGTAQFEPGRDFRALGYGAGGGANGQPIFVGYGIESGPDGYASFEEGADLTGKIALVLRFEPMDEQGRSLFAGAGAGWSRHAGFFSKFRALAARNAAAIVVINPPGADDPRADELPEGGDRAVVDVPVFAMSSEAGDRLVRLLGGPSLMELRRAADEGAAVRSFDGRIALASEIERVPVLAENVGGLLPGSGELARELIVVGAHYDHIGRGEFGSRSGAGEIHEGADDNASGTAGMLMLADKLAGAYAAMPAETPRRSILFLAFDAEESGLQGSRRYVEDPIAPIEDHVLMVNFDMIGRIEGGRLSLAGAGTGEGLEAWVRGYTGASGLDVSFAEGLSGRSDHASFAAKNVPVLFAMIADLHAEYHTADDEAWRLNRVGAVRTVRLFERIVAGMATRPERFAFVEATRPAGEGDGPSLGDIKVRFGIAPGSYGSDEAGIAVQSVSEGASAALGGVLPGDRLMTWNGEEIRGIGAWMGMLARHEPGDVVKVGVLRDGRMHELTITLQGKSPSVR